MSGAYPELVNKSTMYVNSLVDDNGDQITIGGTSSIYYANLIDNFGKDYFAGITIQSPTGQTLHQDTTIFNPGAGFPSVILTNESGSKLYGNIGTYSIGGAIRLLTNNQPGNYPKYIDSEYVWSYGSNTSCLTSSWELGSLVYNFSTGSVTFAQDNFTYPSMTSFPMLSSASFLGTPSLTKNSPGSGFLIDTDLQIYYQGLGSSANTWTKLSPLPTEPGINSTLYPSFTVGASAGISLSHNATLDWALPYRVWIWNSVNTWWYKDVNLATLTGGTIITLTGNTSTHLNTNLLTASFTLYSNILPAPTQYYYTNIFGTEATVGTGGYGGYGTPTTFQIKAGQEIRFDQNEAQVYTIVSSFLDNKIGYGNTQYKLYLFLDRPVSGLTTKLLDDNFNFITNGFLIREYTTDTSQILINGYRVLSGAPGYMKPQYLSPTLSASFDATIQQLKKDGTI